MKKDTKKAVSISEIEHPALIEVKELLKEFFNTMPNHNDLDDSLWLMLETSITHPDYPNGPEFTASMLFTYRQISSFLRNLQGVNKSLALLKKESSNH